MKAADGRIVNQRGEFISRFRKYALKIGRLGFFDGLSPGYETSERQTNPGAQADDRANLRISASRGFWY